METQDFLRQRPQGIVIDIRSGRTRRTPNSAQVNSVLRRLLRQIALAHGLRRTGRRRWQGM
jgi:hypothetical protein